MIYVDIRGTAYTENTMVMIDRVIKLEAERLELFEACKAALANDNTQLQSAIDSVVW